MRGHMEARSGSAESTAEDERSGHIEKITIELVTGEIISYTETRDVEAVRELIQQGVFERAGTGLDVTPIFNHEISSWMNFNKSYLSNQGEKSYFVDNSVRKIVLQAIDCALRSYRVDSRTRKIGKEIGRWIIFKEIKSVQWVEENG